MAAPFELIKVAVAVITDAQQRILITRRSLNTSQGGLWEFPGGKLEKDEEPTAALVREIKEEVNLDSIAFNYLGQVSCTSQKRTILLLVYHVYQY